MFILNDKNENLNDQLIVAPAPTADVHLTDAQKEYFFNHLIEVINKNGSKPRNRAIFAEILNVKNTDIPGFVTWRNNAITAVEKWINTPGANWIDPVELFAQAIRGYAFDANAVDAWEHIFNEDYITVDPNTGAVTNVDEQQKKDWWNEIATSPSIWSSIQMWVNNSNPLQANRTIYTNLQTKLIEYAKAEFLKYGITMDTDTDPDVVAIKDYLNNFDPTDVRVVDLSNIKSVLDDNQDVRLQVLSGFYDTKAISDRVERIMNTSTLLAPLDLAIRNANFLKAQKEISKLPVLTTSIPWAEYKPDVYNWNTPTAAILNRIVPGITQALQKYHIDLSEIKVTPVTEVEKIPGDLKEVTIHIQYVLDSSKNLDFNAAGYTFQVKNKKTVREKSEDVLAAASAGLQGTKDIYEMTLMDALSMTPKNVYDLMHGLSTWTEITLDQFKKITAPAVDARILDDVDAQLKSAIDDASQTPYGYKIWMQPTATGQLKFALTLSGNDAAGNPATMKNTPLAGVVVNFKSLLEVAKPELQGFNFNSHAWVDDFLSVTGGQISQGYLATKTNIDDVRNGVADSIARTDLSTSKDEAKQRFTVAVTMTPSIKNGVLTYMAHLTITDTLTGETTSIDEAVSVPGRSVILNKFNNKDYKSIFAPENDYGNMFKSFTFPDSDPEFIKPQDDPKGTAAVGNVIDKTKLGSNAGNFDETLKVLTDAGFTITNPNDYGKFVSYASVKNIPGLFVYNKSTDIDETALGMFITLSFASERIDGTQYTRTVNLFIPLTAAEASAKDKTAAKDSVDRAMNNGISDINEAKSMDIPGVAEHADALISQIQKISNDFKEYVDQNTMTINTLYEKTNKAVADINALLNDIRKALNDAKGNIVAEIQKRLPFTLSPEMIRTIMEYRDVLREYLKTNPSVEDLIKMLENPNFLKYMKYLPIKWVDPLMKGLQSASDNYKFGYFGGGIALGVAGIASAAAAISTGKTAFKTARQSNSIKIRGYKLISIVTSGISLVALGGAAALMVYFFTQQGGF